MFKRSTTRSPRATELMRVTVALLLALIISLPCTVSRAAGVTAAPHHRCIHAHADALLRLTRSAVELDVDYVADLSSPHNATAIEETEPLPSPVLSRAVTGLSADFSLGEVNTFAARRPLRIHFDVSHLHRDAHICTAVGQLRGDKLGGNVTCGEDDLASAWKRDFVVHRLLPLLQSSVPQWLHLSHEDAPEAAAKARTSRVVVPQGVCGPHVSIPSSHSSRGVFDADFIVYVMAAPLHDALTTTSTRASASASSRTVAWATYCAVERRRGRPMVAIMNFVPSSLVIREVSAATTAAAAARSAAQPRWRRLLLHAWRLLFSADPDRRALEEERLSHAAERASEVTEAYVNQWTAQHYRSLLHELLHALGFAPTQLLRQSTRMTAATNHPASTTTRNASVLYVTAPAVTSAVQSWMKCRNASVLPGAALEQSGPDGTVGAHWERLYFHDDLMAGVLSPTAALSDTTMAFFDSLPYYAVDRRYAEHAVWGYGAGCGFAGGGCTPLRRFAAFDAADDTVAGNRSFLPLHNSSSSSSNDVDTMTRQRYWCEATAATAAGHTQCTSDRRAIGFCFAQRGARRGSRSAGATATAAAVESRGLSLLMEGCPIVEPYSNRVCDTSTGVEGLVDDAAADAHYQRGMLVEGQGYYFGPYSRCFASSDIRQLDHVATRLLGGGQSTATSFPDTESGSDGNGARTATPSPSVAAAQTPASHTLVTSRCLQTRCVGGGAAVELRVGSEWIACPADGRAGVVAVPPTSGFMGWVGCEAAELYCAGAMQLQPPSNLARTSPLATDEKVAPASPLPFYRVTVTFVLALGVWKRTNPLSGLSGSPEGAAAALRMVLISSDRAFQAALQKDLARHRVQQRPLLPLGAVVQQRVVGATRLTSASLAVFASSSTVVTAGAFNANETVAFPLTWDALVAVSLEVVARSSDEALAETQAWLSASSAASDVPATVGDDSVARLSVQNFEATASWLSQSSCAAAAMLMRIKGEKHSSDSWRAGEHAFDDVSAIPADVVATEWEEAALLPACAAMSGTGVGTPSLATWNVSAHDNTASLAVSGPLDVSEQGRGPSDLREVARVHLRLYVLNQSSEKDEVFAENATSDTVPAMQHVSADAVAERWLTHATTLLALTKDVSGLLGVSLAWVHVAAVHHKKGGAAVKAGRTAVSEAAATSAPQHHTLDVSFVVSLPALEELPERFMAYAAAESADSSSAARSSVPATWTAFTDHARRVWYAQLRRVAEGTPAGGLWCPLHHTNVFYKESLFSVGQDAGADHAATEPLCPVVLDGAVSVHAPRPGASPTDFLAHVGRPPPVLRWWERRVMVVGGRAVDVAALLASFVVAVVLLHCAHRFGRF